MMIVTNILQITIPEGSRKWKARNSKH